MPPPNCVTTAATASKRSPPTCCGLPWSAPSGPRTPWWTRRGTHRSTTTARDAAGLLRRALDEPLTREHRAAVLTELGAMEFHTVRSGGIPRLTEALRLQDLPRDKVKAAVILGTALARRGEAHAAFAMLLDIEGTLPDDPSLTRSVRAAALLLSDHDREIRQLAYTRLRRTSRDLPSCPAPPRSPCSYGTRRLPGCCRPTGRCNGSAPCSRPPRTRH